jgi:phosphatidylglycerophosphatase A
LFRFFDITKPLFIRRLEKLPLGWGVMADDLLAGIYTNLIMQIIVLSNLF